MSAVSVNLQSADCNVCDGGKPQMLIVQGLILLMSAVSANL